MQIKFSTVVRSPLNRALLLGTALLFPTAGSLPAMAAADDARPQITREADIPRSTYQLPALPSTLILDTPEALLPLARQLEADVTGILDQ